MKKLSRGGIEALHSLIVCTHMLAGLLITLTVGWWGIPSMVVAYLLVMRIWYIYSRDKWIKVLVKKTAMGKVTYGAGYYYISDEDYYFKITHSDMLIVYQPGKLPIYSTAGVIAIDVLRHTIRRNVS